VLLEDLCHGRVVDRAKVAQHLHLDEELGQFLLVLLGLGRVQRVAVRCL